MYALLTLLILTAEAPKDAVNIEGTWVVVSVEKDGEPYEDIKDVSYVFKGNASILMKGKEEIKKVTYKLGPTDKPKRIDFEAEGGEESPPGIYMLEGDKLTICVRIDNTEKRPTEFTAKKGSKQAIMVLKREKK